MKRLKMMAMALMMGASALAQVPAYLDDSQPLEVRVQDALSRMTTHEKIQLLHAQSKFTSAGVPRLGIRQLNMDDGPHGVREELEWNTWKPARWTNDSVVAFPSLTCLAATWNPELSAVYGNAVSEEFAFRGKDVMLGPGVNMARTPLNGRNFEYMGEDPYLAGHMIVPYIRSAQANGVACCLKHFALNNQEIDRFAVNVNVDERTLHEIYLPAFKAAVQEGGVWTVMPSYPLWNGIHCCQNDSLLNGILKRDWGFDGATISDWGGTTDTWQAATGGLDIEMGTFTDGKVKEAEFGYDDYYLADKFEKLIDEGKIPMSVLDDKATRVLRTIFRTSMNRQKVIGSLCSEAHYDACLRIGEEGIVLLKNAEDMLPLDFSRYERILVVGENAVRSLTKGGGSSELKTLHDWSPLESLQKRFGAKIDYAQGYSSGRAMYDKVDPVDPALSRQLKAEALEKARQADLILFIGGMNKNCRQDCENSDRENYHLSFGQDELIQELAAIQKNIIVCTFGGNAFATPWIDEVKGFVHAWYLGSMAGEALVRVLDGTVNPSGKLPVTFARRLEDYPFMEYGAEAYPGVNKQVYYKEGIFMGYRHFDTHKVKPQFPFGYGLSYTTFEYGKPRLSSKTLSDGKIVLSVDITNTGNRAGKETVQLYIGQRKPSEVRPAKELKAFEKVELQPGETRTVEFSIDRSMLSFFSAKSHDWVVEPGRFDAYVCASSADVRGQADFRVE